MFKQDNNAKIITRKTFFKGANRYALQIQKVNRWGGLLTSAEMDEEAFQRLSTAQNIEPVTLLEAGELKWWWFRGLFFREDERLAVDSVKALAIADLEKKRRRLERAKSIAAVAENGEPERSSGGRDRQIPAEVKTAVWRRDGGRCVECGSNEKLEFDHIVPFSMGGSNTERNIQLLCEVCNRSKGADMGFTKGVFQPANTPAFVEFDCQNTSCGQKLRLPAKLGTVKAKCPSCSLKFDYTT